MGRDDLLQSAIEHHTRGDLPAAAKLYQEVLRGSPKHHRALYLFGCLAHSTGKYPLARDLFARALAVTPRQAMYWNGLGLAAMELGNYEEAETSLQRAIALDGQAEFHNSLGTLRKKQGRITEAMAVYRQAIERDADCADAHYNLGNCLVLNREPEQAAESFQRALKANPQSPAAMAAMGQTLRSLARSAEAIPYLQQAIALAGDDADWNCDLGDAFQDSGEIAPAIMAYRSAIRSNPQSARAWYALGCAELSRKEFMAAIACFQEALTAAPDWLEAEHNLARALFELGQSDDAMVHFRKCAGREELANAALARAMIALLIPGVPSADNASILAARRAWAQRDLPVCNRAARHAPTAASGRPLRIGYISSFFHRANWMKPVWGLINQHDRSAFEIHLFSDAAPAKLQPGYRADARDHVHDISGFGNEDASALIERSAIDILVDLNSYSDMGRLPLLALRPAPIIVGWFNLYATSGLDCFDYVIGDQEVIPAEEERFYTERILRVPGSYLTFTVNYAVPEVTDPPCLTTGAITFGSLASQIKITDRVAAAWSSILLQSPQSRLIVKNGTLGSAACRDFLYGLFARNGVAGNRVRLEGPAEHFAFLQTYEQIDIALDPFPYNGGTTTTEAIWQGVPVLSFWGDRWVSRTSASILRAGGLDEFVQSDLAGYVRRGAELANSPATPQRLLTLRRGMRSQLLGSPVCDAPTFARRMEDIYRRIYGNLQTSRSLSV
jgi:protein O-GlcNAc transferase